MRTILVVFLLLLGCNRCLAETVSMRCLKADATQHRGLKEVMVLTVDSQLGEMKTEDYLSNKRHSQMLFRIEQMDDTTVDGLNLRGDSVLEFNRLTGRLSETVDDKEPTLWDCGAP
jgi:hypothetical protein